MKNERTVYTTRGCFPFIRFSSCNRKNENGYNWSYFYFSFFVWGLEKRKRMLSYPFSILYYEIEKRKTKGRYIHGPITVLIWVALRPNWAHTSWCQRCLGRLVPRSAETPLVKGCIEKDVDKLRIVTALPKYAPISFKFRLPVPWCVLSSAAYSLNWTIPLMMTNRPWYTRRYASLHGRAVFPFESARAHQMS